MMESKIIGCLEGFFCGILKVFNNSIIVVNLRKLGEMLFSYYEISRFKRFLSSVVGRFHNSRIWEWFKSEAHVDLFETSNTARGSFNLARSSLRKGKQGFLGNLSKNMFGLLFHKPLFIVSFVVLTALIVNTVLCLLFKEISMFGVVVRLLLFLMSFLGLQSRS